MTTLQALWEYHEAYLELYNLKKAIAGTEAQVRYRKLRSQLSDLQNKQEALQKLVSEKGEELSKFDEMIAALEHKLEIELAEIDIMRNDSECTSIEAAESTKAVESLLNDVKRLKANMLQMLEQLSKLQKRLKDVNSRGVGAKKEYDIVKVKCEEEKTAQNENLARLMANIKAKETQVKDKAILKRFIAIQKLHLNPITTIENDKCSGCQMSLPTSLVYKVVSGHELIECENCGRLLCNREDLGA